jgi:hypothetical protein
MLDMNNENSIELQTNKSSMLIDDLESKKPTFIYNDKEEREYIYDCQKDISRKKGEKARKLGFMLAFLYHNEEPRIVIGPHCIFTLNIRAFCCIWLLSYEHNTMVVSLCL